MKLVPVFVWILGACSSASTAKPDAASQDHDAPVVVVDAPVVGDDAVDFDAPVIDLDAQVSTGTPIQDVQDGTVAHGTVVTLANKLVTGLRIASAGSVNLYVQEAQGVTTPGHPYPEFAGMNYFFSATEAATFPALATLAVGDCITATGTVGEFPSGATDVGTTQLATITAFAVDTGCGAAPTPFAVGFADIATDLDPAATGNQPGLKAEAFEGVLVTVTSMVAPAAATTNRFNVTPQGGTSTLEIDSFLIGGNFAFPAGQTFSSITGVYSQVNRGSGQSLVVYRVTPRTLAELVTP
jgi:hypothetical protein